MYANNWVANELANVDIADKRIVKRLIKTTTILAKYPHCSIPEACDGWAETKATYRLFDNDKVTPEKILVSHGKQTIERIKKHNKILCVQDTSTADYSTHPATEGLGTYSDSKTAKGLLVHTTMAVTTDGLPLGILDQQVWTRDPSEYGKSNNRYNLSVEQKESNKWLKSLDNSLKDIPKDIKTITVCDQEADVYDFFNKAVSQEKDFLVRVHEDRRVLEDHEKLIPEIESKTATGEVLVSIPRDSKKNIRKRDAKLKVKFCHVTVMPPKNRLKSEGLPNLNLYAILLEEIDPPQKAKPIRWLLLTTLEVSSLEDAIEMVKWYKLRWKIEQYHYVLKEGCRVEELQLETKERIHTALAIYSIIAWKILWLRYESEKNPDGSCEVILKKYEWQALYCMVHNTASPSEKPPALKEAVLMIAKLGGFLGRKGDGEPGVKVIWRGMSCLNNIAKMYKVIHPDPFCEDEDEK